MKAQRFWRFWQVGLIAAAALSMAAAPASADRDYPTRGGIGGYSARDRCPAGSYMVGIRGRAGDWLDQIGVVCAPMLGGEYRLAPRDLNGMPLRGGTGGASLAPVFCPANSAVSGFVMQATRGREDNDKPEFVDAIRLLCRAVAPPNHALPESPVVRSGDEPKAYIFQRKDMGQYVEYYIQGRKNLFGPQPYFFEQVCGPQELSVGLSIHYGVEVVAIGLICDRAPQIASAPPPVATAPPPPPPGPDVGGSWKQSCSLVSLNGMTLTATCRNSAGKNVVSALDLLTCKEPRTAGNSNGQLFCESGRFSLTIIRNPALGVAGSWKQSCTDGTMSGTQLLASCKTKAGKAVLTALDLQTCNQPPSAGNDDGKLVCENGTASAGLPPPAGGGAGVPPPVPGGGGGVPPVPGGGGMPPVPGGGGGGGASPAGLPVAQVLFDVNVRSGPGKSKYGVVATLARGSLVGYSGCQQGWCQVVWPAGAGWVDRSSLKLPGGGGMPAPVPGAPTGGGGIVINIPIPGGISIPGGTIPIPGGGGISFPPQPPAPPSPQETALLHHWDGVWKSKTGAGNCGLITFDSNGLTGRYSPGNGQITGRKVSGNVLTFRWEQDASAGGRYGGTASFTLKPGSGVDFSGSWAASDPKNGKGAWNGCRQGATCGC